MTVQLLGGVDRQCADQASRLSDLERTFAPTPAYRRHPDQDRF